MPTGNLFQHATYSRSDPGDRVRYAEVGPSAAPGSTPWQEALARVGAHFHQAGIRTILFMNGLVTGTDIFGAGRLDEVGGLKRGYSRGISGLEALLALMRQETNGLSTQNGSLTPPVTDDERTRRLLDENVGDAGNFTSTYVDSVDKALAGHPSGPLRCVRHLWGSEYHHLGRADGAWRLLERLRTLASVAPHTGGGTRILIQAHGQAGLVLALVTNWLAPGQTEIKTRVFEILRAYHQEVGTAPDVVARLDAIRTHVLEGTLLSGVSLDVVTFGTPIRYGWDPGGVGRLLHVVNHRPMRPDGKRWLAKMDLPQITMEMPYVWGGDYVQQLAVAVTDAMPASAEGKAACKALWEILEPYDGFERWLECARKCVRCANDGQILLVDYKDMLTEPTTDALTHAYGHAAYTRLSHALFNMTQIAQILYSN